MAEKINVLNTLTSEMIAYIDREKIAIDISELKQLEQEVKTAKHPKYKDYLELSKKIRIELRSKLGLEAH